MDNLCRRVGLRDERVLRRGAQRVRGGVCDAVRIRSRSVKTGIKSQAKGTTTDPARLSRPIGRGGVPTARLCGDFRWRPNSPVTSSRLGLVLVCPRTTSSRMMTSCLRVQGGYRDQTWAAGLPLGLGRRTGRRTQPQSHRSDVRPARPREERQSVLTPTLSSVRQPHSPTAPVRWPRGSIRSMTGREMVLTELSNTSAPYCHTTDDKSALGGRGT